MNGSERAHSLVVLARHAAERTGTDRLRALDTLRDAATELHRIELLELRDKIGVRAIAKGLDVSTQAVYSRINNAKRRHGLR